MEDFLKTYPRFKEFVHNFIQNEEDKIKKEMEMFNIEYLLEKAKVILENEFKGTNKCCDPGFKYKLENLDGNEPDYALLENSLRINLNEVNKNFYRVDVMKRADSLKMYRVVPIDDNSKESSDCQQVLLLHGY